MSMSWRYDWMIEAFREILFFGILASIAVLWRPRSNNTRYGYAEFFTDEDNGDIEKVGSIPLETINVAGGELTRRKKKKQEQEGQEKYESDREKNLEKTKVKFSEFEKDILNFELPSDDEVEISVETQIKKMD